MQLLGFITTAAFRTGLLPGKKYLVEIYGTKLVHYHVEIHMLSFISYQNLTAVSLLQYHAFKSRIYKNTELSHSDLNTSQFSQQNSLI